MKRILAGAQLERPPGRKYLEQLRFAEMAPRPPFPKASTFGRWRSSLPEGFECALVAPRETVVSPHGALRLDETLEDSLEWLIASADAMAARAVVVPTGSEVTTGQRDRDLLAAYFERLSKGADRLLVWAPAGLWEPEVAIPLARKLGVLYGFDPLETPVPAGPVAYARLQAIGGRRRFSEGMLEDVGDRLLSSAPEEVFVAVASPQSFREASLLQMLVDEASSDSSDADAATGE